MTLPFPISHRPYPPPSRPWLMRQSWRHVLFAHWEVPVDELRQVLPAVLPLDTYDGRAWLGVVSFHIRGARPRWLPPLPWISHFAELNVRTYVTIGGRPGVYFFSLDASNPVAVRLARLFTHLLYFDAEMSIRLRQGWIEYQSTRSDPRAPGARFRARYRPRGALFQTASGSLEAWLTERYCLYSVDRQGRVFRGEIHHAPWPLQPAEAELDENSMAAPLGISLSQRTPLLHYAEQQDMVAWAVSRVLLRTG